MKKGFIYYFIPTFILIYFFIAFLPVVGFLKGEFFPIFSFKLYSKIPNNFSTYDLIINKGNANEYFLIYNNQALNKLQRNNYRNRMKTIGSQFEKSNSIPSEDISDLLALGDSIFLVKLTGDYVKAIKDEDFSIKILKKIK